MFVECYADETLVNALGVQLARTGHRQGIGNVCNALKKCRDSRGMVDEDPNCTRPNYLRSLKLIADEHQIKVLSDKPSGNQVIMLCPRLEEWVLRATQEAGADITHYGLSNDPNQLLSELSRSQTKRNNLKQLITDIKDKSPMLKALAKWLMDNP